MKKELQLLLKPVSSECNMDCAYCFYRDEAMHREVPSYGKMTQEIMETVVFQALQSADSCVFGFQGGEPTLAGLDFYKAFAEEVKRRKKPGQQVSWTLQTNGLILDEEWGRFLKEHDFLVGISLDGSRELHDFNRKDMAGKGTYGRVLKNARMLLRMGVPVNILCVLTKQSARRIRSVYQGLKKQGFFYQQYIPCLESLDGDEKGAACTLDAPHYAEALKTLFDLWFEDRIKGEPVFIREIDNWFHVLKGNTPEACAMYGKCTMQNVVEANGDVYPCDFYVLDGYCMGNVKDYGFWEFKGMSETGESTWGEKGENWKQFFRDSQVRDDRCPNCRWYPLCRGGCRKDCTITGETTENRYCGAYREFFAYAIERMEWLAARE
ncbi:MAG: radical SAM protein [Eubacteriales bacterium]|nr:radical SAM protein [Eubacteriales bacterium]